MRRSCQEGDINWGFHEKAETAEGKDNVIGRLIVGAIGILVTVICGVLLVLGIWIGMEIILGVFGI